MAAERLEVDWEEWRARRREDLLAFGMGADEAAAEVERAERRTRMRAAWVKSQMAALRAATERCDAAWMKLVEEHPDEEELDEPPEQAELDHILGEIRDVLDHDRWPRHLYWGGI